MLKTKDYIVDTSWSPSLLLNQLVQTTQDSSYPPYNIYKIKDNIFVELAVAGFSKEELTVTYENNVLVISGEKQKSANKEQVIEYQHRGLAYRNFKQTFNAKGSNRIVGVTMVNGVLVVEFAPVASTPKKLEIQTKEYHPSKEIGAEALSSAGYNNLVAKKEESKFDTYTPRPSFH